MDRFDDNEYSDLIGELLHDTQYIEISNRGKWLGLGNMLKYWLEKY